MTEEMNVEQAAVHFGVSRSTIQRWVKCGKLESRRVGGRRFVTVEGAGVGVGSGAARVSVLASPIDVPSEEAGPPNETAIVVLRDRLEQIERERDLAIRRIGQLEEASSHLSFWRRGMLVFMTACLILVVAGVGVWTWAWNEISVYSMEAGLKRLELRQARSETDRVAGELVESQESLSAAKGAAERESVAHLAKAQKLEEALDSERQERLRLAQDLATAVADAAAKDLLASQARERTQAEIENLKDQLNGAQAKLTELAPGDDSGQLESDDRENTSADNADGTRADDTSSENKAEAGSE